MMIKMVRLVSIISVLLCSSITKANIMFGRNVDITNSSYDDNEEIGGPFITVGEGPENDDNTKILFNYYKNATASQENENHYYTQNDPDDPDEGYDDYVTNIDHLQVRRGNLQSAGAGHVVNFSISRRKNPMRQKIIKLKTKRPKRGKKKNKKRVKINKIKRIYAPSPLAEENNCASCRCGVQSSNRTNEGQNSRPSEFQWIVHLSYFGRLYCDGVLINDHYILTAGHCTRGFVSEMMTVQFLNHARNHRLDTPLAVRRVTKVFRPPSYNPSTLDDDLSLLRISPSMPLHLITPICLPIRGYSYAGKNAIVAGWGGRSISSDASSSVPRKKIVPILTNRRCRRTAVGSEISNRMLCAGNLRSESSDVLCQNDSGGTLIIKQKGRYRLIGLVSWGAGCGQQNHPGIYTRITKYLTWIEQLTNDACWCS